MPRYLMLLFLDYCLLGKRSDCLRVLKDLHLTLIDFPPPLVFPLILSLTDKSRISLCVAVLVSPEPFSHAQLHSKIPHQPLQPLVICTAIDHLFPSKG